ncbi:MAG: hypothetical protein AAF517_22460, partial [Planctomycetota bacterium]
DPTVVPPEFALALAITNNSGVNVSFVKLIPEDANADFVPDFTFTPDSVGVTLPNGSTAPLNTTISGVSEGAVICFDVWLLDADLEQCCVLTVCLDVPFCGDEPQFIRCDCNLDGTINIADPISLLTFLFGSGSIGCQDACDSNDDGAVNIADVIHCLSGLFGVGPLPPSPFPNCGVDPTADSLDCLSSPFCP